MAKHRALGKGLGALIPTTQDNAEERTRNGNEITPPSTTLPVELLVPNPDQPRKDMNQEGLQALADSLKVHGIVQPLIVMERDGKYEIVAGERRWRAARMAGIEKVPVVYFSGSSKDAVEVSLIENIQREDLSSLEIADAIQGLMKSYSMTQDDVAKKVGWSRSAVTNKLRLLNLPEEVKSLVSKGLLSEGHARALLSLDSPEMMLSLGQEAIYKTWSVRQLEKVIQNMKDSASRKGKEVVSVAVPVFGEAIESLTNRFDFKLKITGAGRNMKLSLYGLHSNQIERILNILNDEGEKIFPGK